MIPILTTDSTVLCPHGGNVILTTSNDEARVDGVPVLLLTDVHSVVGCPFEVDSGPRPCVSVRWLVGAIWTRVDGTPVLLQNSIGLCYSAEDVPQGPPVVVQAQQMARGA